MGGANKCYFFTKGFQNRERLSEYGQRISFRQEMIAFVFKYFLTNVLQRLLVQKTQLSKVTVSGQRPVSDPTGERRKQGFVPQPDTPDIPQDRMSGNRIRVAFVKQ